MGASEDTAMLEQDICPLLLHCTVFKTLKTQLSRVREGFLVSWCPLLHFLAFFKNTNFTSVHWLRRETDIFLVWVIVWFPLCTFWFDVCFSVWMCVCVFISENLCVSCRGKHVGRRAVVTARAVWKDFLITSRLCPKHFLLVSCTTRPWGKTSGWWWCWWWGYTYMWETMKGKRGWMSLFTALSRCANCPALTEMFKILILLQTPQVVNQYVRISTQPGWWNENTASWDERRAVRIA